jgi:hypothetical protein
MSHPLQNTFAQRFNGLWLITLWLEIRNEFEWAHTIILQQKKSEGKGGIYIEDKLFYDSNPLACQPGKIFFSIVYLICPLSSPDPNGLHEALFVMWQIHIRMTLQDILSEKAKGGL